MIDTREPRGAVAVGSAWLASVALFVAVGLFYSLGMGRLPHPDEYHHLVAARGMVATGEPQIAEGLYTRGLLHTWMVAQSFSAFGESLGAARLPSILSMAALAAVMFVWLRREAGSTAAWIGSLLFASSPFAADMATFVRFYALQGLAFFAAAALVYTAVAATAWAWPRRLLAALLAAPPLLLAVYLQPTTLLGFVGLGAWALVALGVPWLRDQAVPRRRKLRVVAGLAVLGIGVILAAAATGLFADFWRQYQWSPLFGRGSRNEFWYYHAWYSLLYPSLWPVSGILALAALATRPAPASLALAVFAVGFLLNSFAGAKSLRYIFYAQPFLFALWGIGLAALLSALVAFLADLRTTLARQSAAFVASPRLAGWLVAAALLFVILANPAWLRTISILADYPVPGEQPRTDWAAAGDALAPWLERADIVVSTEELGQLYFLGRYDVRFSPSKMDELDRRQRHEFGLDRRTGRPVIGTRESLVRILECYPSGIIVGPSAHWGRPVLIDDELAALITARAQPLELPRRSQLRAYVWEQAVAKPAPGHCQGLPSFAHRAVRAE